MIHQLSKYLLIYLLCVFSSFFFPQVTFQTELGQALDLMTAPPTQIDLNRFTIER